MIFGWLAAAVENAMVKRRHPVLQPLALILACVGILAACSSGSRPSPQVPGPVEPTSISQTVGAGGGTINGPNGITLSIPPDALAADVAITVAVDSNPPAPPAEFAASGGAVTLTPHGTTFAVPVTITVPFDPSGLSAGTLPVLLKTIGQNDGWQQLVTERTGNMLTAATTSFSTYVPGGVTGVVIIRHPRDSIAVDEGAFWIFNVEAMTGTPPLAYQWLADSGDLRNQTNSGILLRAVRFNQVWAWATTAMANSATAPSLSGSCRCR